MYKPGQCIKSLKHQEINCSEKFTILCWNVAKLTLQGSYHECLKAMKETYNIDILLLQEVKKKITKELELYDYSYVLSPNIETKKHLFGVLSAFKISCEEELSILTQKRELVYATHKVSLITRHKMAHDKELLIVNLHAINFVKSSDFNNELQSIKETIKSHKGPMIVAGDFNTWNIKRVGMLRGFANELSLKEVGFSDSSKLKKVFTNCLDYIFYRDLELTDSKVIESRISDHNPIIAFFKL